MAFITYQKQISESYSVPQRLTWVVVLTGIWYLCLFLIFKAYVKWVTSPVIVTFASTETPISTIPFPAVTVCPEVNSHPQLFNFTEVVIKLGKNQAVTDEEQKHFLSSSLVCNGNLIRAMLDGSVEVVSEDVVDNLRALAAAITLLSSTTESNSSLYDMSWLNRNESFFDATSIMFTKEGICFTFNALHALEVLKNPEKFMLEASSGFMNSREWSYDRGYFKEGASNEYPRRTFLSGFTGGVVLKLYASDDTFDHICGDSLQGFKMILHHPAELPDMDRHIRIPLDQAVNVGIKPTVMVTDDELKSYSPEDRKCYYSNERFLKYYKIYTLNNCLEECISNYTLSKCGCLGFYMPKDDDSLICGPGKMNCMEESKVEYHTTHTAAKDQCKCLPSCNSIEYEAETSQTNWDWQKTFMTYNQMASLLGGPTFENLTHKDHYSQLSVYFKQMHYLRSERHQLYGYVDFFSSMGGLMGLFTGFSVTSVMEILYFLTLRLGCNIKKYGKRFWSGDEELIQRNEANSNT